MDVGDLLEGCGKFWLVRRTEPHLWVLEAQGNHGYVQPVCPPWDQFTRLCNPSQDWPAVTLPQVRHGILATVTRADFSDPQLLGHLKDWVRMGVFQIGGALYLNPALGLGFRDRLIVTYQDGGTASVDIPRDFQPLKVKTARLTPQPAPKPKTPPVSLFGRLLADGDDE